MKARPIIKRKTSIVPLRQLEVGEVCQAGDYFGPLGIKTINTKINTK